MNEQKKEQNVDNELNDQIKNLKVRLFDINIQIESFQQLRMQEMNKLKQLVMQQEQTRIIEKNKEK